MKFDVCHHENGKWMESLRFYAGEVKYFKKLLEEVKEKNTNEDLHKKIVDFENQFTYTGEVIDNLTIGIQIQEQLFADYAQDKRFLFDEQMELIHERQRSAFEILEKDFTLHKSHLYHFLGEVL